MAIWENGYYALVSCWGSPAYLGWTTLNFAHDPRNKYKPYMLRDKDELDDIVSVIPNKYVYPIPKVD